MTTRFCIVIDLDNTRDGVDAYYDNDENVNNFNSAIF